MTESELIAAIVEHPDDDAPRLVYADWLMERGDPRGELIALQCGGQDRHRELVLLAEHASTWLGTLGPALADYEFARGFLVRARMKESTGQLAHPLLATVRSLQYAFAVEEHWSPGSDHTATPQSGGEWTYSFDRAELAALAVCAKLPALRELVIDARSPNGWLDEWTTAFVATKTMYRLESLGFVDFEGFGFRNYHRAFERISVPKLTVRQPGLDLELAGRIDGAYRGAELRVTNWFEDVIRSLPTTLLAVEISVASSARAHVAEVLADHLPDAVVKVRSLDFPLRGT